MFRPVVVVPVYNHDRPVADLVRVVRSQSLPCILVDDASSAPCAAALDALVREHPGDVTLVRHARNMGKGGAVLTGARQARASGFSHMVQIDADGQHDAADIPAFLSDAERRPDAFIAGQPIFDDSIPRGRLYPRYLTHFMVSVNTLTPRLRDAMCGFRVYPLDALDTVVDRARVGLRMDFDVEVFVRLAWARVPIVLRPTRVRYPADGVSHFRLWRDNALITRAHTLLFLGMLARLPLWAARGSLPT